MVIGTAAFFFVFDACKSQDARVKAGGDGEGFRCHPGRAVREGIGADIFFDGFFGDSDADRIVLDFKERFRHVQDVIAAVIGLAGVGEDALKFFIEALASVVVAEEAAGAGKGQAVGDDVEDVTAVQAADGEGQTFFRWYSPHPQGLHIAVEVVEAVDGAFGQVRPGAVAAVAVDADFKAEAAGHGSFVADSNFACRNIPADVGRVAGVDMPGTIGFQVAQEIF